MTPKKQKTRGNKMKKLENWTPEEIAAKEAELKVKWIDSGKANSFSNMIHKKVAHYAAMEGNTKLSEQAKARRK